MSATGPRPIADVAAELGLADELLVPAGRGHLRVEPGAIGAPSGRHVLVTAISPTQAGEGKTVTTLGLGMGLAHIGQRSAVTLRQSSFGPTFGMKGGGVGGGAAAVVPFREALLGLGADL
ncbi:MAG: formate--tetrahydrofolate ligase, partial [Acidimicrobiales bacterium]|nr:formate--tetrahydrofolate ligase [Acidimicrobiales bacterium]